jgi:hypothetical protein
MVKPIKPETMPLGTHTPNLWMTSHPTIHKEKKAGLAVISRPAYLYRAARQSIWGLPAASTKSYQNSCPSHERGTKIKLQGGFSEPRGHRFKSCPRYNEIPSQGPIAVTATGH